MSLAEKWQTPISPKAQQRLEDALWGYCDHPFRCRGKFCVNLSSSACFQCSRPTSVAVDGIAKCCCSNLTKQNLSPSSLSECNDSHSIIAHSIKAYRHGVNCFLYSSSHPMDSSLIMCLLFNFSFQFYLAS